MLGVRRGDHPPHVAARGAWRSFGAAVAAEDLLEPGQTNVTFAGAEGVTLRGYLAAPEGSGRLPAVLMIHEWWGLNRDVTRLADAFRGSVARSADQARRQVAETPREQIAADLDAAFAFVKSNTYQDGGTAQRAWNQMVEFLNRTLKG